MASDELVAWLRPKIERDLREWRDSEAHFKAVREREGDYHYFEARERVAQLKAELAVLDLHAPVAVGSWEECGECGPNNQGSTLIAVPGDGDDFFHFPCKTVRLLGYGYRFRPGYRKAEWKP